METSKSKKIQKGRLSEAPEKSTWTTDFSQPLNCGRMWGDEKPRILRNHQSDCAHLGPSQMAIRGNRPPILSKGMTTTQISFISQHLSHLHLLFSEISRKERDGNYKQNYNTILVKYSSRSGAN